ncbi:hypothetical protein BN2475_1890002 [Paraburkholderia ribeironis]|uniref:Uncharacterized protein n=1 Tax=Paraburkholderia ribeironis TaxID=1247936 RepID=A0A1N7SQW8_9BURK|nr:hypothetical protein BN2475_1890002 [Paraburkholderia ribeironis]
MEAVYAHKLERHAVHAEGPGVISALVRDLSRHPLCAAHRITAQHPHSLPRCSLSTSIK